MRSTATLNLATTAALAFLLAACADAGGSPATPSPPHRPTSGDKTMPTSNVPTQTATLGGGCFWCLEAFYERIDGIVDVESGYSGGHVPNPSYEQVCTGTTGHAEVIQIEFDPAKITFREILQIFFTMHDPTTLDRQGADEGTQYRSVVLYRSPEQKSEAEKVIRELTEEQAFAGKIVTQIVPFESFYPAEISHQDYYARNPNAGYCRAVIAPKLEKLRKSFANRLKAEYR